MSWTDIKFIPLTFINSDEQIKKQIRNTIVFMNLSKKYNLVTLSHYLEDTQYGYTASALNDGKHKLLRITDINEGNVSWDRVPFCNCEREENYLLKNNDILVARTGGTTGKSFLVSTLPPNVVFASYLIRLRVNKKDNPEFISAFLNSYTYWSQISKLKNGSAQPNVNAEKLKTITIPNCDIHIQNQVVNLLKENIITDSSLSSEIESVETLYDNIKSITQELLYRLDIVKKPRQQILQDAIQGKLVTQDKSDEHASILLEKIKAEKAQLIADKKLKKDKDLQPMKLEEIPFDIPDNWVWCKLGNIGDLKRGKSKHRPRNAEELFKNGMYPLVQTGDVSQSKKSNFLISTYSSCHNELGLNQSKLWKKGTFCITIAANIAEVGFLNLDACIPDSIVTFNTASNFELKFLRYYFQVTKEKIEKFAPATAQKNINLGILSELLFPLPPLAGQNRIVAKVEELMKTCDELEQNIKNNQKYTEQLMQVALKEALTHPPTS